ncbi:MAG TPA: single-stranded DNA-binding protein [Acidimicrobiales bacterium]|nr:single-stranded DNA-binding protein [Acidimicrobiales bacterium]
MNSVNLTARLAAEPKVRGSDPDRPVAVLRLAIPRRSGEAAFVNAVCFEGQARSALEHLHTGRRVGVSGRLHQRVWTDAAGQRRERHEVLVERLEFLDRPAGDGNGNAGADDELAASGV